VATFGEDKYDAILTSMLSASFKLPKTSVFLCIGPLAAKMEFLDSARDLLALGLAVYCSQGTHDFFQSHGLEVKLLQKPLGKVEPNIGTFIDSGKIDLVINVRDSHASEDSITDGYLIRRKAVDSLVPLLTDIKLAVLIVAAMARKKKPTIKAWDQFGS